MHDVTHVQHEQLWQPVVMIRYTYHITYTWHLLGKDCKEPISVVQNKAKKESETNIRPNNVDFILLKHEILISR